MISAAQQQAEAGGSPGEILECPQLSLSVDRGNMLLSFVDEASDVKFPEYFGLCIANINSAHYRGVKSTFHEILLDNGWDPNIEFKGSYLFSASKGCKDVNIDKRIEITASILDLTASEKNSRIKFFHLQTKTSDQRKSYLRFLPLLLNKSLPIASRKNGKDLLTLHCDQREDMNEATIRDAIIDKIGGKGYTLYEDVVMVKSCFHTVGILYADIVGYLLGRIDAITMDSELFDGITEEDFDTNGKLRKLKSSKELIGKVKVIKRYVGKLKSK